MWSIVSSIPEKEADPRAMAGASKHLHVTPIGLAELKETCTHARRTETSIAPRHVDVSRDALLVISSFVFYFIFFRTSGVGGGAARFSLFVPFCR